MATTKKTSSLLLPSPRPLHMPACVLLQSMLAASLSHIHCRSVKNHRVLEPKYQHTITFEPFALAMTRALESRRVELVVESYINEFE